MGGGIIVMWHEKARRERENSRWFNMVCPPHAMVSILVRPLGTALVATLPVRLVTHFL